MNRTQVKLFTILAIGFSLSTTAMAGRTIRIVSTKQGINLTNPSAIAVNYDVVCHSASGSTIVSVTNQSLSPNASTSHGVGKAIADFSPYSSACVANNAQTSYMYPTWNVVPCPGSATYDNASALCADGLEMCEWQPPAYQSCGYTGNYYWMKPPTGQTVTFSGSGCTWTTNHTLDTSTQAMVLGDYSSTPINSGTRCSADNGTNYANYCSYDVKTASHGVLCCPKAPASYCKVTINTTDPAAFLASPQFKGGTAF